MTTSTVKIIIAADIEERKVEIGRMEVEVDEKLDEGIYQGMQTAGKALYGEILQALEYGLQEAVPETWENTGRERRQMTTCMN